MDYRTYQQIRTYCCHDLRAYLDLPGYDDMRKIYLRWHGQIGLVIREEQLAHSLHQCSDLPPRGRAPAELFAVISNHWIIAWPRSPEPPNGNEPAPPLEKVEADALERQTRDAVKRYAAFLPEPERAVLLEDCETALEAAPAGNASKEVRLSVTDQQNNEILKCLKDNGYDPLKLPVPPSGKSGVKKLCRVAVKFSSKRVFDTAWDRLRFDGAIKDAK